MPTAGNTKKRAKSHSLKKYVDDSWADSEQGGLSSDNHISGEYPNVAKTFRFYISRGDK